jgi:hypothetical protein
LGGGGAAMMRQGAEVRGMRGIWRKKPTQAAERPVPAFKAQRPGHQATKARRPRRQTTRPPPFRRARPPQPQTGAPARPTQTAPHKPNPKRTRAEGLVVVVHVRGQQVGAQRVGARDQHRRHVAHVGREARGLQLADKLLGGHEDLRLGLGGLGGEDLVGRVWLGGFGGGRGVSGGGRGAAKFDGWGFDGWGSVGS